MTTTPETSRKAKAELTVALMEIGEGTQPIFDHAKGLRVQLEADGWSPTIAEAIAAQWVSGMLGHLFLSAQQGQTP